MARLSNSQTKAITCIWTLGKWIARASMLLLGIGLISFQILNPALTRTVYWFGAVGSALVFVSTLILRRNLDKPGDPDRRAKYLKLKKQLDRSFGFGTTGLIFTVILATALHWQLGW